MSMEGPGPSRQEKSVESIPTKEEILSEIGKYCENPQVTLERKDAKGIYFLRAEVPSTISGEIIDYTYQREGTFDNMTSGKTSIYLTHMKDGEVIYSEDKAQYTPETKKWQEY